MQSQSETSSTTASPPQLYIPQEIADEIVAQVASTYPQGEQDWVSALRTCSLLSSSFHSSSRKFLFAHIDYIISGGNGERRARRLLEVLEHGGESLLSEIRSLRIYVDPCVHLPTNILGLKGPGKIYSYGKTAALTLAVNLHLHTPHFLLLFRKLSKAPRLYSLTLEVPAKTPWWVSHSQSNASRAPLVALMLNPSIRTLHLIHHTGCVTIDNEELFQVWRELMAAENKH